MEINKEELVSIIEEVVKRVKTQLTAGGQSAPAGAVSPSACGASQSKCSASASGECGACGECIVKTPDAVKEVISTGACRISAPAKIGGKDISLNCSDVASYIDHTLLKPDIREEQVVALCKDAAQHNFASVCINPAYIELCSRLLRGSSVKVCTVVGFPLGSMTTESKAFETRDAVAKGADEIDMVINVAKLKDGDFKSVIEDIQAVVKAAQNKTVKVIIEAAHLTDYEKVVACILTKAAGAHFVKTSTGFGKGGATVNDVALMRKVVGKDMGIKAAGGIKDCETALDMINAGATRIGASASVQIISGAKTQSSGGSGGSGSKMY